MKIKAPFIFDPEFELMSWGHSHPQVPMAFMLGWLGWKYYISHPWTRCKCGTLADGGCCHKCPNCECEMGS